MRGDICTRHACRTPLDISTDGDGRTIAVCKPCERNKAGLCRDCPAKLVWHAHAGYGNQMRCRQCQRRRDAERHRRARAADPEHHRQIKRASDARLGEAGRQRRLEAQRRRRREKPEPYTVLDRLYGKAAYHKRKAADPNFRAKMNAKRRAWMSDPAVREKYNADQRRYRAARKARAA